MPVRFVIKHEDIVYAISDLSSSITKKDFSLEHINVKRFDSKTLFIYSHANEITSFLRHSQYLFRVKSDKPLNRQGVYELLKETHTFYKQYELEKIDEHILQNRFFIITNQDIFQIFDTKTIVEIADIASYNDYENVVFEYYSQKKIENDLFGFIKDVMSLLNENFKDIEDNLVIINNKNNKLIWKDAL